MKRFFILFSPLLTQPRIPRNSSSFADPLLAGANFFAREKMHALLLAALSQPLLPTTEAPPTRCADAASTASLAAARCPVCNLNSRAVGRIAARAVRT